MITSGSTHYGGGYAQGLSRGGYPLYCGDAARSIIRDICGLLEQELAKGAKVFFYLLPSQPR